MEKALSSKFKRRLAVTLTLWAVIVGVLVLFGRWGGLALLLAAAFVAQLEAYILLHAAGYKPRTRIGLAAGVLIIIASMGPAWFSDAALAASFVVITIVSLYTVYPKPILRALMPTVLGILLVPYCLSFYGKFLTDGGLGLWLGIWSIAVVKCADAGALIFGRAIGRTPLWERLSPQKTWEGVLGSIVGALVVGLVLWMLFLQALVPFWAGALISVVLASTGIVSDLLQSALKREAGAKDSGGVLPGIGGVFDLVDSMLLSAPVAYFCFLWLAY